jgi:GTP-binding protein Era
MEGHKAGFVNIVGNPNVGKSTLMNALVGEKISIITSKAQTTRHRIMGIVNADDFQIIYSDTPGVLKPNYKLQESMLKLATSALEDADVVIYVTDPYETFDKNEDFLALVNKAEVPVLLVINKIDLSDQVKITELAEKWQQLIPRADIIAISALHSFNIDMLLKRILELLPVSPPFFPKDQLTDKTSRFFMSEIIREKILTHYQKEIPYSTEVEIEEFVEEPKIIRISAIIYTERESQKGIIIGKKGEMLKKIGTLARKDAEAFFDKQIFLQLFVKVRKDWRNKSSFLRQFGYLN